MSQRNFEHAHYFSALLYEGQMDRIIALVDMDCFYVQVEQRLQPEYKGKPCAVVQYKTWKGGGIIAVGYEARACGVTRSMFGDDAKKVCPDIHFFRVPEYRGKADLTKFRDASKEVMNVLSKFSTCVERASIDEAYIDLTDEVKRRIDSRPKQEQLQNTYIVGYDKDVDRTEAMNGWLDSVYEGDYNIQDKKLAVGAMISDEMRAAVYEETGFRCSAGIAHNKMLAKLACGIHKPNKQTILPHGSVPGLFNTLHVRKIRNLGGKLGESIVEDLNVEFMGDLVKFSLSELQQTCGDKTGHWIYEVCRGIDHEPVSARQLPKSIGCSKNFPGKTCLDTKEKVKHWLKELSEEVVERLEKDKEDNNRSAKTLTVSVRYMSNPSSVSVSRTCAVIRFDAQKFAEDALTLIQKLNTLPLYQSAWSPPITCLGISAGKFVEFQDKNQSNISSFLGKSSTSSASPLPMKINKQTSPKSSIESFFKIKDGTTDTPQKQENSSSPDGGNKKLELTKGGIKSFFKNTVTKPNDDCSDRSDSNDQPQLINVDNSKELCSFKLNESKPDVMLDNNCKTICDNDKQGKTDKCLNTEVSSKKSGFFAGKLRKSSISSDIVDISDSSCDSVKYMQEIDVKEKGNNSVVKVKINEDEKGDNSCVKSKQENNNIDRKGNELLDTFIDKRSPIIIQKNEEFDEQVFMSLPPDIQHELKSMTVKTKENRKEKEGKQKSGIDKFFNQNLNKNNDQMEDMTSCEKCGKYMLVWELPEHIDFHLAQDIQKELRQEDAQINRTSSKRKSDVISPEKSKKKSKIVENVKTLTNFFFKK